MPDHAPDDSRLALVHEGWEHLKHQRPLAAWASWQRVLRDEPDHPAANHALQVLATAGDLPDSARAVYRFLTPSGDDAQRARWDARFQGRDLEELVEAARAFAGLADGDPVDPQARFNHGLCLAWLGRNAESVAALDLATQALTESEPEAAIEAWALAEVIRQGGGAEPLADDLNHVVTLNWLPGHDPAEFLDDRDEVGAIANPIDPLTGSPRLSEARLYEWLDRPWAVEGPSAAATFADLRRLRATVVRLPGSLRLSGTDPVLLEEAVEETLHAVGHRLASIERSVTPLPLAFLDAAVWAIRMPPGLDDEARARLNRSAIERYYEVAWLQRPRHGLGGLTPAEAARLAAEGDALARVRLSAVVRLREQLGLRPSTALLYQGYPFDRLRRRLGLPPTDPETLDPSDAASMSGPELDALDPSTLDDFALAEAYESAAALGLDRRTARFADALAARDPSSLARLDVRALFGTLVRVEVADDSTSGVLRRVDQAQAADLALTGGRDRATFETWRAEALVRLGQPDQAVQVYRGEIERTPDPLKAVDAAETLLDAGFDDQARALAQQALDLAEATEHDEAVERAKAILIENATG